MSDIHYGTEARMLEAEMERRAVARRAARPRFEPPTERRTFRTAWRRRAASTP
jgi:hypothetical protein